MNTHRIPLLSLLTADERQLIDSRCAAWKGRGDAALPPIAAFLKASFGADLVLDPDIVAGFVGDQSHLPGTAAGVARPETTRECAAILRACSKAGLPVTLSGGRSNLTGSATPHGGVVMSLGKRLHPPVAVDLARQLVTAPVGMILEELRREVIRQSRGAFHYPVDPTSRGDSSVGGTLACNASGFIPGERGATRERVESIEVVLAEGGVIRARRGEYRSEKGRFHFVDGDRIMEVPVPRYDRPRIKNAGGPFSAPDGVMDFIDWIVGSEGIYGVITDCTLRIAPRPRDTVDLFIPLPDEAGALTLLEKVRTLTGNSLGVLGALEYFGVNCRGHMDHEEKLFRGDNAVAVYLQIPVGDQSVEEVAGEWLDRLAGAGCPLDPDAVLLMDNERDRAMFMEARHSLPAKTLEVVQQRGTFTIMTDCVVPPDRFREFLDFTHNLLRGAGMDYVAFGHLGDCHLHFTLLPDAANLSQGTDLYDRIVAGAARLGGVYSGEHGTGKRKRKDFLRCYGAEGVQQVLRCKQAVDPALILNPGNVIEPC